MVVVTTAAGFMGADLPAGDGIMTVFEVADLNMKASSIAASFAEAPTAMEAVFTTEAGSTEEVTADTANSPGF